MNTPPESPAPRGPTAKASSSPTSAQHAEEVSASSPLAGSTSDATDHGLGPRDTTHASTPVPAHAEDPTVRKAGSDEAEPISEAHWSSSSEGVGNHPHDCSAEGPARSAASSRAFGAQIALKGALSSIFSFGWTWCISRFVFLLAGSILTKISLECWSVGCFLGPPPDAAIPFLSCR